MSSEGQDATESWDDPFLGLNDLQKVYVRTLAYAAWERGFERGYEEGYCNRTGILFDNRPENPYSA